MEWEVDLDFVVFYFFKKKIWHKLYKINIFKSGVENIGLVVYFLF